MILNLSVKNFLIIESVYIDFTAELPFLKDKDSAEKSLILDALLLCFGYNLHDDNHIQTGKNSCTITSEVNISHITPLKQIFEHNGIGYDDTVIIKRYQTLDKKPAFFINDQQVTPQTIKQIASKLLNNCTFDVDFDNPVNHADILDRYGKLESCKQELKEIYHEWQNGISKFEDLISVEKGVKEEMDYLEATIRELSQLGIKPEEELILLEQINELQQTISNQKLIKSALKYLNPVNLSHPFAQVSKILGQEASLTNALNHLEQSLINLDASKSILQNQLYETSLEYQIFEIEERLFEIRTLAKKHGVNTKSLHLFFQENLLKLQGLKNHTKQKTDQSFRNNELFIKYQKQASLLNQERQKTATDLEQYVSQILGLDILKINIETTPKETGNVKFILLNPEMKNNIASSLKLALAQKANQPTILFKQEKTSKQIESFIKKGISALSNNYQIILL